MVKILYSSDVKVFIIIFPSEDGEIHLA